MSRKYVALLEKLIYNYCDNNIGRKVLFPVFMNLLPEIRYRVKKKNLTYSTSKIVNKLISENILKEIPKKFESVYGMYEIL